MTTPTVHDADDTIEDELYSMDPVEAADEYFTIVPNRLLKASGQAIKLYMILSSYLSPRSRIAWPARATLASQLGLKKAATVDRYLDELERLGAIEIMARHRPDGGRSSSGYRILRNSSDMTPSVGKKRGTPVPKKGQGGVPKKGQAPIPKNGQLNLDTNMNLDNPHKSPEGRADAEVEIIDGQLDAIEVLDDSESQWLKFWSTYPRKASKQAARRAWDKITATVDPSEIIAGAERYRDDPNRVDEFTKHPSTWLNAGCWEDAPLPARTGSRGSGDRAADMFSVKLTADADGMVTLPSGRRVPAGVIAPGQLALD